MKQKNEDAIQYNRPPMLAMIVETTLWMMFGLAIAEANGNTAYAFNDALYTILPYVAGWFGGRRIWNMLANPHLSFWSELRYSFFWIFWFSYFFAWGTEGYKVMETAPNTMIGFLSGLFAVGIISTVFVGVQRFVMNRVRDIPHMIEAWQQIPRIAQRVAIGMVASIVASFMVSSMLLQMSIVLGIISYFVTFLISCIFWAFRMKHLVHHPEIIALREKKQMMQYWDNHPEEAEQFNEDIRMAFEEMSSKRMTTG